MVRRTYGSGNDTFNGTGAWDTVYGGAGNDTLRGYGGNDRLYAQDGDDRVYGGIGNDRTFGDVGNDRVFGEDGDDVVGGGIGTDTVSGGRGADFVSGNIGNDALYLGLNDRASDVVQHYINTTTIDDRSLGSDTIYEFEVDADKVDLGDFMSFEDVDNNFDGLVNQDDSWIWESFSGTRLTIDLGGITELDYDGGQRLTLVGATELTEENFLFGV